MLFFLYVILVSLAICSITRLSVDRSKHHVFVISHSVFLRFDQELVSYKLSSATPVRVPLACVQAFLFLVHLRITNGS